MSMQRLGSIQSLAGRPARMVVGKRLEEGTLISDVEFSCWLSLPLA